MIDSCAQRSSWTQVRRLAGLPRYDRFWDASDGLPERFLRRSVKLCGGYEVLFCLRSDACYRLDLIRYNTLVHTCLLYAVHFMNCRLSISSRHCTNVGDLFTPSCRVYIFTLIVYRISSQFDIEFYCFVFSSIYQFFLSFTHTAI